MTEKKFSMRAGPAAGHSNEVYKVVIGDSPGEVVIILEV